ncbi:MAG: hypothetical protein Q9217_006907 [Psora testacea]
MTELRPILARLGLEKYVDRFADEGFETWDTILDITESDLDALGVKLGHRRILQREIALARGVSIDQSASLNSPSQSYIAYDSRSSAPDEGRGEYGPGPLGRTKRKYRRHPKADENAPDRPPSAYVIFSNKIREEMRPLNLSFADIAKKVGESWQVLSAEEKEPYETQASAAKEKYHTEMAAYKMTDSYRDYMRYLAEFKAKNAGNAGTIDRSASMPQLTFNQDGKRPRLEHEQSTASSASLGSGTEHEAPSSNIEENHRRVNSTSSIGPYSTVGSLPSPASISSRCPLSHGSLPVMLPIGSGSPMSTSPSSPSVHRDASRGPPRPSVELYPDRLALSGGSHRHLPRILPNETSISGSSTTPTDSRLAHPRRSPLGSADSIPTLIHQASDSSKSSITSSLSNASTAPSSIHAPRALEEDPKTHVLLPPLPAMTHLPKGTFSPADHVLRPSLSPHTASSASPYTTQQTSQSAFPSSSGTDIDSLELPLPHKIFFGQKPEPWPKKGAKLANIFDLQDIPGARERYPPRNLTLQSSSASETSNFPKLAQSPQDRLPGIHQINAESDGSDVPTRPKSDPLSVLADAAYADRNLHLSSRRATTPR